MDQFVLKAPYAPSGDQPQAIEGRQRRAEEPDSAGCDRERKDVYDGFGNRKSTETDAGYRSQ